MLQAGEASAGAAREHVCALGIQVAVRHCRLAGSSTGAEEEGDRSGRSLLSSRPCLLAKSKREIGEASVAFRRGSGMCSCLPTLCVARNHPHRHPHQRSPPELAPPSLFPCPTHTSSHTLPHILQEYLDVVQNRTKEKRYTFDVAFDPKVRGTTDGNAVGWDGVRVHTKLRSSSPSCKGVARQ